MKGAPDKAAEGAPERAPGEEPQADSLLKVSHAEVAEALKREQDTEIPSPLMVPRGSVSVADAVAGDAPAPTSSVEAKAKTDSEPSGPLRLIAGFDEPMAVVHDAAADVYLVSNLNSRGGTTPGMGYVSRVSPKGKILKLRWIDGAAKRSKLRTPRGMTLVGGRLYVADRDLIHVYDSQSGRVRKKITIKGATQLNGLSPGSGGAFFAADSSYSETGRPLGTDAVYRVSRAGRISPLIKSKLLGHPSSVAQVNGVVWIGTLGSGRLHGVDRRGNLLPGPKLLDGRLSGLKVVGRDDVVVTSLSGDSISRGSLTGKFKYLQGGIPSPGHPGWDAKRRRLLVPSQRPGEVHVLTLAAPSHTKRRRR